MDKYNYLSVDHPAVQNWVYHDLQKRHPNSMPGGTYMEYLCEHAHHIHAQVISPDLHPWMIFDSTPHLTHFLLKYSHEPDTHNR